MPLTNKGEKIMANMKQQYGSKKGKEVFYASQNKGTIEGTHKTSAAEDAYIAGFVAKCAAAGIDPVELLKQSQVLPDIASIRPTQTLPGVIGAVSGSNKAPVKKPLKPAIKVKK